MFRKFTATVLIVMLCLSNVALAQESSSITVMEKLSAVENALYGDAQTGALMDRIAKLETDFLGERTNKSMVEKVDFLYDGMFTTLGGQPSTIMKVNAVEWSITHAVTSDPVKNRVESLETMIEGSPKSGAFQARILELANLAFAGGVFTLTEQTVTVDSLIKIALTTSIDSKTAAVGDKVTYQVAEDVVIDGTLVFAKGAQGTGTISKVSRSQNFGRDAKLEVNFERITAVDGSSVETVLGDKAKQEMENMALAAGASIAGMVLLGPVGIVTGAFVKGKDAKIAEGAQMYIQTKADTVVYGVGADA